MNLPNYFLADLPPEATFTPPMISEACQALKKNREQYLASRTTLHLLKVLSATAEAWLDADFPFRRYALEHGPAATGFSAATLARGLDAFFNQLTHDQLKALLVQELGHLQRLDEMIGAAGHESAHAALARGPELLVHIAAGNIPSPTLHSIVLGLLTRSAQFVKCARGTSFLPRLFAHSLYDTEPKLAACLEIAEWAGGDRALEEVLFAEADCVTATGHDDTLADIRQRLPMKVRFLAYGHRVSFGYVAQEVLSAFGTKKIVAHAVDDIVAWNQLGCLSPHVLYVENGGTVAVEPFAELLAAELGRREETEPRGALSMPEAAVIAARRDFYSVRASASETRVWQSENSTAWTVVYENDARFQQSCGNRFIYVKAITDLDDVLRGADSVRGKVSTVGLSAHEELATKLAAQLARWGVTRVCPLGRMQAPPLTWRHDGRPALGDLVTWTDWER
jgi:hypothetical protein